MFLKIIDIKTFYLQYLNAGVPREILPIGLRVFSDTREKALWKNNWRVKA